MWRTYAIEKVHMRARVCVEITSPRRETVGVDDASKIYRDLHFIFCIAFPYGRRLILPPMPDYVTMK